MIASPLISGFASASSLEEYNQQGLDLAQKKISRQKRFSHEALLSARLHGGHNFSALEVGTASIFGRGYKVGDTWDVAAWQIQSATMRKMSDPDMLSPNVRSGGTFHYEVTSVKPGDDSEITVKVTQTAQDGMKMLDHHIDGMFMTFCDHGVQSDKSYAVRGLTHLVPVSPEGLRGKNTQMELLPLDVPEVSTAERSQVTSLPTLPTEIQNFAEKIGYQPNLSKSTWMEQDDFFGRPVQMLWEKGNPWPSYMRTANGISILIRKGTL